MTEHKNKVVLCNFTRNQICVEWQRHDIRMHVKVSIAKSERQQRGLCLDILRQKAERQRHLNTTVGTFARFLIDEPFCETFFCLGNTKWEN